MRLPVSAIIMICISGILFFLYISFNYAFMGPHGLKYTLWSSANRTMSGQQLSNFNNLMPQLTQGFGISCVLCFVLAIVLFVIEGFSKPGGGQY